MFTDHPITSPPPPETKIWRYMSLEAYIDLLVSSSLHMSQLARMEDPWEGLYGEGNVPYRRERFGKDYEWLDKQKFFEAFSNDARKTNYVSWHASPYESAAMWDVYAANGKGVAVRARWDRLTAALKSESLIYGSKVSYIDHATTAIPEDNGMYPVICKRLSYEHEREVRLIGHPSFEPYMETPETPLDYERLPPFFKVPFDLTTAVDEALVAPRAQSWVQAVVEDVTRKYGFDWPVTQSPLLRPL
ncbi:MAG: DUF2971 domain-containing protein [Acidobacteriota bacterium]|nr:DUF2971 domain-containing protein [Acidobacteriota bacterium]